ncbi:MAG: type II toxin-antitoxin system PemK/MazF family toxin [Peptostreptococcaceae bacterium]
MNRELEIKRGDIYWVRLGEGVGSIQGGVRPVVIVSNDKNNHFSPILTIVPISTQIHKIKLPTHVRVNAGDNGLKQESFIMAEQVTTANKTSLCGKIGRLSDSDMVKLNRALEVQINLVHTKEEEIAEEKLDYLKGLESFIMRWVFKGRELMEVQDEIRELRRCVEEYNRFCRLNNINDSYNDNLDKYINVEYRKVV